MKWRHLAYIGYLRKVTPLPKTFGELKQIILNITVEETSRMKSWDELIATLPNVHYSDYSSSELATYLGIKTKFHCPLTPVSSVFGGVDGKRQLLAFYLQQGYNVWYPPPQFTKEQQGIISFSEGCVVVNAGPGTGKTTTAVERAMQHQHEGVIIVSYSNEAVLEIYKRFKEYPSHRGVIGFKEFKKASGESYGIVVTTIDSLAWFLTNKGSISTAESSHTQAIQDAISAIRYGNVPNYRHLIVDESQDIDDDRGTIVKGIYGTGLLKSLAIFGDPRQRIMGKAGKWYAEMWVGDAYEIKMYKKIQKPQLPIASTIPKSVSLKDQLAGNKSMDALGEETKRDRESLHKEYDEVVMRVPYVKVGFTITHRFKNKRLLDLHNSISSKRKDLHVELTTTTQLSDLGKIRCYNVGDYHSESGLVNFAKFIKESYIDSKFCSPSDIAIVMPSVTAENQTSKKAQRIAAIFRDQGVNSYTRREGSFIPNGILISTIHSIKGKQFKVVIIYCMSNFPKWYPQIPYDEADGLIYVANTRAELEIIYLTNNKFGPPRGVDMDFFEFIGVPPKLEEPNELKLEPRMFGVTDMVGSHGWQRLTEVNRYSVTEGTTEKITKIPPLKMDSRLYGVMMGLIIETFVTGKHLDVLQSIAGENLVRIPTDSYIKHARQGHIFHGRFVSTGQYVVRGDAINSIYESEYASFKECISKDYSTLRWREWFVIAQIYDFICGEHTSSRYEFREFEDDAEFPLSAIRSLTKDLHDRFGTASVAEGRVNFGYIIGEFDLGFMNALVELKCTNSITPQHRQQIIVYNALLQVPRQHTYVLNINTGELQEVTSPLHPMLWRYMTDVYATIRNHTDIVVYRKNSRISKGLPVPEIPELMYMADTEFDGSGIFDFAMVNVSDPYASVVQALHTTSEFAVKWIGDHHLLWSNDDLRTLFHNGRKMEDIAEIFYNLRNVKASRVLYYKAREDATIPGAFGMQTYDLGPIISRVASKHGGSTEPVMSVRLGEIYDITIEQMSFQPHLHQHSALTDALVLYEMFHLGQFL